ncbi:MAG TPA: SDR family oxidoreductase [Alphaproteobacteria bacterium]|nr:SDR family oxidoreductase [Alphaproteobacteria bacterium]
MVEGNGGYPSLKDRVAIVTGGGRGLGYEMAMALMEAGAKVMITSARETGELDRVAAEAKAINGDGELAATQADVCDYDACERVVRETKERFGAVHCLVNNAARGLKSVNPDYVLNPTRFFEHPVAGWHEIITTNLLGPFHMARAAAPGMVAQGFGRIINISTSDITMIRKGYSPYGPTKAAVEAMSRVWAQDLAGTGVTVNVYLPGGATDTAILPDMENKRGADGNLLEPGIMRAPILWLCSDASNEHSGERYIARLWDDSLPPAEAAARARDVHHDKPGIM